MNGYLIFTLQHVDTGTSVAIIDRPGLPASSYGCSGDNADVILDDEALSAVESECTTSVPTINGTFQANNLLSAFDSEALSGTWTMIVSDNAGGDVGTLDIWCLKPTITTTTSTTYALTVTKSGTGTGTVTASPVNLNWAGNAGTATYNSGTSVTLSAAANTGSTFTGWSGGGCSGNGPCSVSMNAAKSVTATFISGYKLTLTKSGTGTGTVTASPVDLTWIGKTGTATYSAGASVTLTAAANTGSTFTGWSGGGCSGTGTCIVTMNAAQGVTATFTLNSNPPTVAGATPTNNTRPTWRWVSGGGGGNGIYRWSFYPDFPLTFTFQRKATSFTPPTALPEGDNTLYVQESDAAGNWSTSGMFTITINATLPPPPPVTDPKAPTTQNGSRCYTWTWSSSGGTGTFRYKLDDPDLTTGATVTTNTSFTACGLAPGPHTFYLQEQFAAKWPDAFSWGSVTASAITVAVSIPSLTQWGLVFLAILLIMSGVFFVRGKRRMIYEK